MATMFDRIKQLLPLRAWFTDSTPVLDAVVAGISSGLDYAKTLIDYVRLQTRILTATDGNLDMISSDFFGLGLSRKPNQSDKSFRAQILASLFLEKATRRSMAGVLKALTGREPVIVEPTRPLDTGAYGVGICGYGAAGAYGSINTPWQVFVGVYRPAGSGVPFVGGWGIPVGGYGVPSQMEWAPAAVALSQITDADIYHAIDATKPAGTTVWVRILVETPAPITEQPVPEPEPLLLDGTWSLNGAYTLKGLR
jgi:hypothetical protein